MRKSSLAYLGFCLALVFLVSSCRLALVVVKGGDIQSASGRFSCLEGNNCVIEITSADFRDTFIAVPKDGYEFSHWLSGNSLLCGGSTNPRCQVSNQAFSGNQGAQRVIESDRAFYILPVFNKIEPATPPDLSPALQTKYDNSCAGCHPSGRFGAPRTHDVPAWEPLLAKGIESLLGSVKNGRGAMPPGGDCGNCSDDDYRALITYMSGPES